MDDNYVPLEVKIGEKSYRFAYEKGSYGNEILSALCEFQYFVMSKIKEIQPIPDDQSSVVPDEVLPREE